MADVPRAVLSEQFQERMKARRLRSAVFLTFQFDSGFFEQEVLPVFIDVPLSHAAIMRVVHLEDALRTLPGHIAVYYDANGLVSSDAGSAKLDIRRIPVQHRPGVFHPKNVFLLVEADEPDDDGHRAQALIAASLSANLTRTGWWENVEACHLEEIEDGDKTRLKEDLASFLEGLRRRAPAEAGHLALREILTFLRRAETRLQKSSSGQLHPHFYAGPEPVIDFLDRTAGDLLHNTYLEIISPYFDDAAECRPLQALIERFQPKEVRVFLPRSSAGHALCRRELYHAVRALREVSWGHLSRDIVQLGRSDDAGERFVHAKVYRFFTQTPKREVYFLGSANLTAPGHQGQNLETGFLVEVIPPRRPDFWLTIDKRTPSEFEVHTEGEDAAKSGGTRLNLRYHWDRAAAEAFWDARTPSPELRIETRNIELGRFSSLPPRTWTVLSPELTERIGELLKETSLFLVHGDGEAPAMLLVQEEGMAAKPSLFLQLSAADILRYWALLTPAQRTAFLDTRAPELALAGPGADLVARSRIALEEETFFDRFAGFFHSFACMERATREALAAGREREVDYRLFGQKYDSLGNLLNRVTSDDDRSTDVDRYVIILCARQLCLEIKRDHPDYWSGHAGAARALEQRLGELSVIRQRLAEQNAAELPAFLDWFERRFMQRAAPLKDAEA